MDTKLLITFIILNIFNVIIQTSKTIVTVKCGKTVAAFVNAVAYGLYTIVTVYMLCDLELWLKAIIVAIANLIGVYAVKFIEEKKRKDKLWKIEATVHGLKAYSELKEMGISCNYLPTNRTNEYVVNCFCPSQSESTSAKQVLTKYNAKYFVSESKIL